MQRLEFAYATSDLQSDMLRPARRAAASLFAALHIKNYGSRRGTVDYPVTPGSPFDDLRRGKKYGQRVSRTARNSRDEQQPITDENAQTFIDNALVTLQTWVQRPLSVLLQEQQEQEERKRNQR